ncbi:MAG: hypothetical protein QFX38_07435 [Methanothermobacter sp.]|nr:hypothetical protein [Methanothermobacter sp.]
MLRRVLFFALLCSLLIGGVSASNSTYDIVAPGCTSQNPGNVTIEINQTKGWTISGPAGSPPSQDKYPS